MNTSDFIKPPSWVPPKVVDAARLICSDEDAPTEVAAVIRRLLMDERMKTVWAELNKCKRENYRSTDRNFHFSKLPPEVDSWAALAKTWKEQAEENRELGDTVMAKQFEFWSMYAELIVFNRGDSPIPDDRRHEYALALFYCFAVAVYCAAERSVSNKDVGQLAQSLINRDRHQQAKAFRKFFAKPEISRLIVDRQRTEPRLKAFIESLAHQTKSIFGGQLARTIATVTNVAFERSDFSGARVKAILKDRSET